jgi:hypothetical protein
VTARCAVRHIGPDTPTEVVVAKLPVLAEQLDEFEVEVAPSLLIRRAERNGAFGAYSL